MGFFETIGDIAGEIIAAPIKVVKAAGEKVADALEGKDE